MSKVNICLDASSLISYLNLTQIDSLFTKKKKKLSNFDFSSQKKKKKKNWQSIYMHCNYLIIKIVVAIGWSLGCDECFSVVQMSWDFSWFLIRLLNYYALFKFLR